MSVGYNGKWLMTCIYLFSRIYPYNRLSIQFITLGQFRPEDIVLSCSVCLFVHLSAVISCHCYSTSHNFSQILSNHWPYQEPKTCWLWCLYNYLVGSTLKFYEYTLLFESPFITAVQTAIFHRSCSYLVQLLTSIWAWTLFHRIW